MRGKSSFLVIEEKKKEGGDASWIWAIKPGRFATGGEGRPKEGGERKSFRAVLSSSRGNRRKRKMKKKDGPAEGEGKKKKRESIAHPFVVPLQWRREEGGRDAGAFG